MIQDLAIIKNSDGLYDLNIVDNDFQTVAGFETAILASLFSDDRAPENSVVTPSERRGWIGNILTAAEGTNLGSLLWLYEQARLTDDILNSISTEAQNALQWLVTDGEARSVSTSATRESEREVRILVDIIGVDGQENRYSILWSRINGANLS